MVSSSARPRGRALGLALVAGLAWLAAPAAALDPEPLIPDVPFPSAREYFEPLLADPTEPSYGGRLIYPPGGARYGETTIGDYVGITRWKFGGGWNAQLNFGGGAISRFNLTTPRNSFEVVDFSAGVPLDIALEHDKVVRIAWWHTSSHLGDDYIQRVKPVVRKLTFDAMKVLLSWTPRRWLRGYGGGGYAFNSVHLDGRGTVQIGAELMSRPFWRTKPRAYLAQDFQAAERRGWNPSYNVRGGLRWTGEHGIAAASLFMEYFTGVPYYLQFKEMRESHWGFGLRFEIGNPIK